MKYNFDRDITINSKLDRIELFHVCEEIICYNRTDYDEFGTVYSCDAAVFDRLIGGRVIHLEVRDLRWIAYNSGATIIVGEINGVDYIERY